jgi:hypothetical protein
MSDQGGSREQPRRVTGPVRLAGTLRASTWTIAGIGVAVLLGALVFRELGFAGATPTGSPSPDASAIASPTPSPSAIGSSVPSAEASPDVTTEPASPSPTGAPLPAPTVTGELPGPGATVPPTKPVIAGLRFDDLVAATGPLGLACRSSPNPSGSYHLVCEAQDPHSNGWYTVEAEYWTLGSVTDLYVSVISIDHSQPVGDPTAVARLLEPIASLLGGQATETWVASRLDDPACGGDGCQGTFDGYSLLMTVGSDGWGSLEVDAG